MSDAEQILKARANALARPPDDGTAAAASLDVLQFHVGPERYAIETRHVVEVWRLRELTALPSSSPAVLGIVNIRGRIVPVFDLRRMFDLPEQGLADLHHIVVVKDAAVELGVLADATIAVRRLPQRSLQESPAAFSGSREAYLKGITADGLVVLDVERLLADPGTVVHEEVEGPE